MGSGSLIRYPLKDIPKWVDKVKVVVAKIPAVLIGTNKDQIEARKVTCMEGADLNPSDRQILSAILRGTGHGYDRSDAKVEE